MIGDARRLWRMWLTRALVALGVACLAFYSVVTVHTWRYQRAAKSQVEQSISIERPPAVRDDIPFLAAKTG